MNCVSTVSSAQGHSPLTQQTSSGALMKMAKLVVRRGSFMNEDPRGPVRRDMPVANKDDLVIGSEAPDKPGKEVY